MTKIPSPPTGLSKDARDLWNAILGKYELDPDEMALLREAVRCKSNIDALQIVADKQGMTTVNSQGNRHIHPAVVEARAQRVTMLRLLERLRLADTRRSQRTRGRLYSVEDSA